MMKKLKARRRRRVLLILVLFFGFVGFTNNPVSYAVRGFGYTLFDYFANSNYKYILSKSQEETNELILDKVPGWIVDSFYSDGGVIKVGNEISDYGTYSFGTNEIVIKEKRLLDNDSLAHELGHYAEHTFGNLASTEEFRLIAAEEMDAFSSSLVLCSTNPMYAKESFEESGKYTEYFADTFGSYCLYPTFLKMTCPKTYEYMRNLCEV